MLARTEDWTQFKCPLLVGCVGIALHAYFHICMSSIQNYCLPFSGYLHSGKLEEEWTLPAEQGCGHPNNHWETWEP